MTIDEIKRVQGRLAEFDLYHDVIDGKVGKNTTAALLDYALWTMFSETAKPAAIAVTVAQLKSIAPRGRADILEAVADGMRPIGADFGISTSPLRLCHFIAQAAHESDGFKTTREYWGPTSAQKRYEGRADLGNTEPGDGKRFMGRGIFMYTGRANYAAISKALGIDFIAEPELAAVPSTSTLMACHYWRDRNLNDKADRDDLEAVTRAINGGINGLADRAAYLKRAKAIWA